MRSKNPEYKKEIIAFVNRYYEQNHESPTCGEIAANTPLQRTAVYNYLCEMRRDGEIEYDGKRIVTPFIKANRDMEICPVGIIGTISCGIPEDAQEHLEGYFPVPASIVGKNEMYILYADGKSMIGAGIDKGDLVLVKRQETANDGDIVVAYVEGEGNTLKRLRHRGKKWILHPENPDLTDMEYDFLKIQGVAVWVFKKVG